MKLWHRAILISVIGNTLTVQSLLLWHGVPFLDSCTIVVLVSLFGALTAIRATWVPGVSLPMKRILVGKFASFFPVLALVLHALGWAFVRQQETGRFQPSSNGHWLSIILAMVALVGWFVVFHRLERNAQKPNDQLRPIRAFDQK